MIKERVEVKEEKDQKQEDEGEVKEDDWEGCEGGEKEGETALKNKLIYRTRNVIDETRRIMLGRRE